MAQRLRSLPALTRLVAVAILMSTLADGAAAQTRPDQAPPATTPEGSSPPSPDARAAGDAGQPPALGALVKKYPGDLKRFWSKEDAVSLGVGAGLSLLAHRWDDTVGHELTSSPGLSDILKPGNLYGAFPLQAGVAFTTYVVGRAAGRPRLATVSADVVRAQLVGQSYAQLVKVVARRDRPDGSPYSFPSAHAASAFTTASVLEHHYGGKIGVPAYALAAYVAAARISDNRHYLSDVVFGAAIGVAAGHTVTRGYRCHQVHVAPAVVPGGVGVVATVGIAR